MINIFTYSCIYHPYNQNYILSLEEKIFIYIYIKKVIQYLGHLFIFELIYMRLVCALLCLMLISRVASGEDQLRLDLKCGRKTKWRAKVEVMFWLCLVFKIFNKIIGFLAAKDKNFL